MGAFKACKESGYNILMVDQRAHRESSGKCITFGVKERYDCVDWIYEACTAEKELYTVPGAGHGMSYLTDVEGYMGKFKGFLEKNFTR